MRTKPQPSQPHPGANSACSYAVVIILQWCVPLLMQQIWEKNDISLKTVYLMEKNRPWVSEVFHTKLGSWGTGTLRALIGNSLHCTAERGCNRARGGQTGIGMILLKNVLVPYLNTSVTLQCPLARHSDGPADFILLGAFHRSAKCTLPSNAKSREGRRENRANHAEGQRYATDSSGYIILLYQLCTSEQRPCQIRKSFPHPTRTSVLRLSVIKKRIWILKPFKPMPKAGANKNRSELWAMLITVASFH